MPEIVATVDVGTNTAHLLISAVSDSGEVVPVHSETRFVRLGQGIDASREIHPDALRRLREALSGFAEVAIRAGARQVLVAGTSASRDAKDPNGLIQFVKQETGLDYRIVSGDEEAYLTSLGAMSGIEWKSDTAVIVDIGGGSTEVTCVAREDGGLTVEASASLDLGSVRVTERCFGSLPPSDGEVRDARTMVKTAFAGLDIPANPDRMFVGAAGTIRVLAMLAAGVSEWAALGSGDVVVSRETCRFWCARMLEMDYDSILALNPTIMQGRADLMTAGLLILDHVFDFLAAQTCTASPRGLRHGLALHYASLKNAREG